MFTRRSLLLSGLATAGLSHFAFANAPTARRVLLVLLRGGLDGLAAVPAIGDPAYASARGSAALDASEVLALHGVFGLHPALAPLMPSWKARELAFVHATGLAGGGRSHFDAQDVLDNGTATAQGERTGWLNRATRSLDPSLGSPMAFGRQVPLVLRGSERIRASDPLRSFDADPALLADLERMYSDDTELSAALSMGLETRDMLDRYRTGRPGKTALSPASAKLIGALLAAEEGPRIGVLEIGGWDTHVRQAHTLERRLGELATGLLGVKEGLGGAWQHTVILAVSEFGRSVRGNGTGGTDHGTGGVVLLAGGAVKGGEVYGQWPGLGPNDLLESRDLRPTLDVRSVFKGLLVHHLGVDREAVERNVFPNTREVQPLEHLFG